MERVVEGLREYLSIEGKDHPYFFDIEYQLLRHNQPDHLLPVQVREIDGKRQLLYEVSGMQSVETAYAGGIFSEEDLRRFMTDFKEMIMALDRFMLDISQVRLSPSEIFWEKTGSFWWVYAPDRQDDTGQRIERLFEWILASIDYDDIGLVQFAYYSYWYIRNHPFSDRTLETCLRYHPQAPSADSTADYKANPAASPKRGRLHSDQSPAGGGADQAMWGEKGRHHDPDGDAFPWIDLAASGKEAGYTFLQDKDKDQAYHDSLSADESVWPDNTPWSDDDHRFHKMRSSAYASDRVEDSAWYEDTPSYVEQRKRKEEEVHFFADPAKLLIPEILCGTVTGAGLIALLIFTIIGLRHQALLEFKYIIGGLMIGTLAAGEASWILHRKRKKANGNGSRRKGASARLNRKDLLQPSYDHAWEEEGGTEVLGIRKNRLQPAFKNHEDGRIHIIDSFPFYIGSEPDINQMVIDEPSVSRRHAAVIRGRQTGNYDLQDLKSTNGTWIGQTPVTYDQPVRLEPGSQVRFAMKSYEFMILDYPFGENE